MLCCIGSAGLLRCFKPPAIQQMPPGLSCAGIEFAMFRPLAPPLRSGDAWHDGCWAIRPEAVGVGDVRRLVDAWWTLRDPEFGQRPAPPVLGPATLNSERCAFGAFRCLLGAPGAQRAR